VSGWPWPGDTELSKARKVAIAYREHLHTSNPTMCDALDDAMRDYGQMWVLPKPTTFEAEDAITAEVAGELVSRSEGVIRRWASTPHPDDPSRMLLPRFGWDGPRRTFLVADVLAAAVVANARLTYRRTDAA
jgi:hypothetical protein